MKFFNLGDQLVLSRFGGSLFVILSIMTKIACPYLRLYGSGKPVANS